RQQLTHDSNNDSHFTLTPLLQTLAEGSDDEVGAMSGKSRHVKDGPQMSIPPLDQPAWSVQRAARLTLTRRQTGKSRQLRGLSKLVDIMHLRQEGRGDAFPHTGNRKE